MHGEPRGIDAHGIEAKACVLLPAAVAGAGTQPAADRRAVRERAQAERAFDRSFAAAVRAEVAAIVDGVAAGGEVAEPSTASDRVFDRVLARGDPADLELLRDASLARRLLAFTAALSPADRADDGEPHRRRMAMLLSFTCTNGATDIRRQLTDSFNDQWKRRRVRWGQPEQVDMYPELQRLLTAAVCSWAGVPLRPDHRAFVQEVRRTYPFFPATAARARRELEWRGARFHEGTLTILDLHGTSMDPDAWVEPDRFLPERHLDREPNPFDLVPQGGGDHAHGHRCAGEWITIDLMLACLGHLARDESWSVPPQDLRLDLRRLPALPRDGVAVRFGASEAVDHSPLTPPGGTRCA